MHLINPVLRHLSAMAVVLAVSALGAINAHAADIHVQIDNFTFSPQKLTVPAGTTVIWENRDDIPHTVTASGKAFRSKALDTGDTFTFAFTRPGVYEYFCSLHPHMTGIITVEAAGAKP